jgi:NAD/NADP transhydrogenase alpha subunit
MKLGIPADTLAGETRVAAAPERVKKLLRLATTPCLFNPALAPA